MKKIILFNPFNDAGITSYAQFKKYPFLVFGSLLTIKNKIGQQIRQLKNKKFFGERLILLGTRGIGKTSTLYFLKDMLEESKIRTVFFNRLFEDEEHFRIVHNGVTQTFNPNDDKIQSIQKLSEEPLYILVDFPDTVDNKTFSKFLDCLSRIMSHKNQDKINLIFSMNNSHYQKSFSYSEAFGKFMQMRLSSFDEDETEGLIKSRLKLLGMSFEEAFTHMGVRKIFEYSKGIPRNIISACNLLFSSNDNNGAWGGQIDIDFADKILKDKYITQIIEDRVEDLQLRGVFNHMISILKHDFNGTAKSKESFVRAVKSSVGLGRNSAIDRIKDLERFGIVQEYRGGYNKVNRIISLNSFSVSRLQP